jgi:SOS-response transcriptional repressor LexA
MPADEGKLSEALDRQCRKADDLRWHGQWEAAMKCCEAALRMARQEGESMGAVMCRFAEGFVLLHLGAIHLSQDKSDDETGLATKHFREAMAKFQDCKRRRSQSVAWMALGETHLLAEDWEEAVAAFQHSLNTLESLRPTDRLTIELKDRAEEKRDYAQSAHFAHLPGKATERGGDEVEELPSRPPGWRRIPILGTIMTGTGRIAEQNMEGYLLLGQEYTHDASFAVHVQGQSMIEAGILKGDLALIREQPAVENGTIAAVLILLEGEGTVNGEGTLKRYFRESDHHRLEPRNATEPTIIVIPQQEDFNRVAISYQEQGRQILAYVGEVQILGKLVGIFREVP